MDVTSVATVIGSITAVIAIITTLLWDRVNRVEERVEARLNNLENRLGNIENRLGSVEKRLTGIEGAIRLLSNSVEGFGNALIDVLAIKNVISDAEALALKRVLSTIPMVRTKYYTEEDYKKLRYLIVEKPYEEYTWEDIQTLREIAEHMYLEALETGRRDLIEYRAKLLVFIAIAEGHLMAGLIGPNRKRERKE
ncbi:hypothetical protein [Vulcanisaeta thermophila]|uniref:hypothetical protein n=1 Tax=Vulcanisaeta thermophila TaxID=867917 RepID=UPI000853E7D9|nr:hypothetical protein [Vulcanisaeta thermophila]